jgi:hypothetical protein
MLSFSMRTHRRAGRPIVARMGHIFIHHRCRSGWLVGRKALSGCVTTYSNSVSVFQANAIANPEIEPDERLFLPGFVFAASVPAVLGKTGLCRRTG